MRFVIKLLISVCIILFCTWIVDKHKLPTLAGLITVMPLTSLIVLIWLYLDNPGKFNLPTEVIAFLKFFSGLTRKTHYYISGDCRLRYLSSN